MYTCPGSIELERGRVSWRYEEHPEGPRRDYVRRDLDFHIGRVRATPSAFIRFGLYEAQVRVLERIGGYNAFKEMLTMPPDTPLEDLIEATLNLLRIGYQPED